MDDLSAAFELVTACDRADYGAPDELFEDMREVWHGLDLAADGFLVCASDGQVVGLATVEGHATMKADVYVHPAYRTRGIGSYLVRLTEARARERTALVDSTEQVVLDHFVNGYSEAAGLRLRAEGYTLVRHHWRMLMSLEQRIPEPRWPHGIIVRTAIRDQDERAVHAVLEDVWADVENHTPTPFEEWCSLMVDTYRYDPALWWIAEDGAQIAGVALGVDFPDMGWVRLLGVRRPWRRQGIALALLRQAFREFKQRGQRSVGLGVDADSTTGATELYRRAGMQVDKQFDQYRKVLRSSQ
jgi:ribosomal protein S18 acetylase RimI-like enzyme